MRHQCPAVRGPWEQLVRTKCALRHWLVSLTTFTRVYSWGCSSLTEEAKTKTQRNSSHVKPTHTGHCFLIVSLIPELVDLVKRVKLYIKITLLNRSWGPYKGLSTLKKHINSLSAEKVNDNITGKLVNVMNGSLLLQLLRGSYRFLLIFLSNLKTVLLSRVNVLQSNNKRVYDAIIKNDIVLTRNDVSWPIIRDSLPIN